MAIAYKSAGAGASTETSGAALSPACPAVVDAGDILIAHVLWEGTADTPSTPSGWTLLHGPEVIQSTVARHWVFGKIAAGTEDGAAVAFGSPAVTTQRGARVYSFSGRVSGTISQLVAGFAATSHATDPQMPAVTTTAAGALAVACVCQHDNNALAAATGESGGDWAEAVAEYVAALTPGLVLQLQTCTPTANPGTVSGGAVAATNDPSGVIGFQIRAEPPTPITGTATQTLPALTQDAGGDAGVRGTTAHSLPALSQDTAGSLTVAGTAAQTLPALTQDATGALSGGGVTGSASSTLPPLTQSAAAAITVTASAAQTLPPLTTDATGESHVTGSASGSLPGLGQVANGALATSGAVAETLPPLAQDAGGTVGESVAGTVAQVLPLLVSGVSGSLTVAGGATSFLGAPVSEASGAISDEGAATSLLSALSSAVGGTVGGSSAHGLIDITDGCGGIDISPRITAADQTPSMSGVID